MIIRPNREGSILIRQPDHAALSEGLMTAWRTDGFPPRASRPAVLVAVREHDNGWLEPDAIPIRDPDTGLILDFVGAPLAVRQSVWPRGVERVLRRFGPYEAALVAQHPLTVYERHRGEKDWSTFLSAMEDLRDSHLALARAVPPRSSEAFLGDYAIVSLGDLLSLVFCNGWTGPFEGWGYRIRLRGLRLTVSPDPFEGAVIPLSVHGRLVQSRPFDSDDDLRDEYERAPRVRVEGEAVGVSRLI